MPLALSMPALLTRMSMRPKVSITVLNISVTCGFLEISEHIAIAWLPLFTISSATRFACSAFTSLTITLAPC